MSSLYKVTEIEGKGLGCVAILDIEKGSLILNESSQMRCIPVKRRLVFTAISRTKRSAGLPSMYVLHIAVTTNPSETFVFTAIWSTK